MPNDSTKVRDNRQPAHDVESLDDPGFFLTLEERIESLEHDRLLMIRVVEELDVRLDVLEARIDAHARVLVTS